MHLHARPQPPNCKGCALSLINKQSDSHWKATNTCIANAVDWIQNPIDTFRIHMEIWVFEYSFKKDQKIKTGVSSSHINFTYWIYSWHRIIYSGKTLLLLRPELSAMVLWLDQHWGTGPYYLCHFVSSKPGTINNLVDTTGGQKSNRQRR